MGYQIMPKLNCNWVVINTDLTIESVLHHTANFNHEVYQELMNRHRFVALISSIVSIEHFSKYYPKCPTNRIIDTKEVWLPFCCRYGLWKRQSGIIF